MDFFNGILTKLVAAGTLHREDAILVVCGGLYDANSLRAAGFKGVTISNVDERKTNYGFAWSYQDAEDLTFADASFDWVMVNAGLHHCASPHKALLEMYRVCRKGVLLVEARDSALMRLAVRLKLVPEFELEAVVLEGYETGGVRNSAVPNFIYRWTEREVRKTIESAFAQAVHRYEFFYGLTFPDARLAMSPAPVRVIAGVLKTLASGLHALAPRQGNKFGAAVLKTGALKPWMDETGTHLRKDYILGFDPERYTCRSTENPAARASTTNLRE
jgi:SAM-dependent methyltransferase